MEASFSGYIFKTIYIAVALFSIIGGIALFMAFFSLFFKRNKVKIFARGTLGLFFLHLSFHFSSYLPLTSEQDQLRVLLYSCNLFFLFIFFALLFDSFIKITFWNEVTKNEDICTVPPMVIHLSSFFIYLISSFLIMRYVFDQPITALAALSGSFIFILGLGTQSVASDFFTGLALSFSRNIRIGDWHLLENDVFARITGATWRSVMMETGSGHHLVFPNTEIAKKKLNNLSWGNKEHFRWPIEFIVDTENVPPSLICKRLEKKIFESPFVSEVPKPRCRTHKVDELGIAFILHVHSSRDDWWDAYDDGIRAIWQVVSELGLQLSFKNKIKHKEAPKLKPFTNLQERVDEISVLQTLQRNIFFKSLSDDDHKKLVEEAKVLCFEAPDAICKEGEEADSLYLIMEGEVAIYVKSKTKGEIRITTLGAGDFFGHASFLLGQKRNATARVGTFCKVLVISKGPFRGILERNPSLAETLAHEASLFEKENAILLEKDEVNQKESRDLQSIKKRLLTGIKNFYRLA